MPNIDSPILDAASRQPLPPMPEKQCKNFEAAKDSAFREDLATNNGGPYFRGPIPGGAEPSGKGGPSNKATGVDGAGLSLKFEWDIGGNGRPYVKKPEVGGTVHIDGTPGKGVGGGMKDGEPGVAYGNTKDGTSVYTLSDATKKPDSSSSTCGTKSDAPEGLKWVDQNKDLKGAIPPAAAPEINDLGPSTNEPEQKPENGAVARNDEARLGDDIAQRI
jgi:hypothetical protein